MGIIFHINAKKKIDYYNNIVIIFIKKKNNKIKKIIGKILIINFK